MRDFFDLQNFSIIIKITCFLFYRNLFFLLIIYYSVVPLLRDAFIHHLMLSFIFFIFSCCLITILWLYANEVVCHGAIQLAETGSRKPVTAFRKPVFQRLLA